MRSPEVGTAATLFDSILPLGLWFMPMRRPKRQIYRAGHNDDRVQSLLEHARPCRQTALPGCRGRRTL